jgi:zinc/manganese transport system permease protein
MLSSEMIEIVMPALFAGIMIALTHAPLGIEVLRRGIIFIDLAIAQIAGFGLVLANYLAEDNMLAMQLSALAFALAGAFFFRFIEKKAPEKQEAIIGCSFVLAASASILVLSGNPHGAEEVQHLLSGQILFVTWDEIFKHLPVYILILALWLLVPRVRSGAWFYVLFALAITSSVQLAGVYVVFASLILPALASSRIAVAWVFGIASVVMGIIISVITDAPAGPVIVCSYVALTGVAALGKNIYKGKSI